MNLCVILHYFSAKYCNKTFIKKQNKTTKKKINKIIKRFKFSIKNNGIDPELVSQAQEVSCNFIKKETPIQVFSCESDETFKNNFFVDHIQTTASVISCFSYAGYPYRQTKLLLLNWLFLISSSNALGIKSLNKLIFERIV